MPKLLDLAPELAHRRQHGLFDDFHWNLNPHLWTAELPDGGSAAAGDAAGGVLSLVPSDATVADNDEAYLRTTHEVFRFAADKPLRFECRLRFTEANVDDANVLAGLMDAVSAGALQDNGGGPRASYSGAVFFKVDGSQLWQCETSVGASKTTSVTAASSVMAASTWQTLRIEFRPNGSDGETAFLIDGLLVARHNFSFSTATEMQVVLGVKNGSANNETLLVDYVACHQLR
jgi:hypothetical protein